MTVQIVRFSTDAEVIPDVEDAIRTLFAAVEQAAPSGIRYSAVRVGDGPEFVLSLELADDSVNPLREIPEALEFRAKVAQWAGAPVPPQPVTVLGGYSG